jgi:hypothetical protein
LTNFHVENPEDYKELTAAEEEAIETLLSTCDWTTADMDMYTAHLTDELSAIESVCSYS